MHRVYKNTAAVSIFPLLILAGCPKRIEFGPEGELHDAAALLALTRAAEDQVQSIKGESKLTVHSPKANGTVTLFVAVSRPARVHFESLDFFGRPQAVLVSDGRRFSLWDAQQGRFYQGPASPQNVSRFLPVVLPPEALVELLLGEAPRLAGAQPAALSLDRATGAYVVTLEAGNAQQTLWIHPRFHRVVKSQLRGPQPYDAEFDDFEDHGALVFAKSLGFASAAADTRLQLRYTEVSINEELDPSFFQLERPSGAALIEVDERGQPLQGNSP